MPSEIVGKVLTNFSHAETQRRQAVIRHLFYNFKNFIQIKINYNDDKEDFKQLLCALATLRELFFKLSRYRKPRCLNLDLYLRELRASVNSVRGIFVYYF
jgi:hypothetical protein